jgi:hypothetical protein
MGKKKTNIIGKVKRTPKKNKNTLHGVISIFFFTEGNAKLAYFAGVKVY